MAYTRRQIRRFAEVYGARGTDLTNGALELQGDIILQRNAGGGRPRGFNALPRRLEMKWVAGATGLPQLSAVRVVVLTDTDAADAAALTALLAADPYFEIVGTNATSATATFNAEGGVKLTTTTGAADSVIIIPRLAVATTDLNPWVSYTWGSDQETAWECELISGSSVANSVIYHAGLKLTNTPTLITDADQTFFRAVGAANWMVTDSNTDVDNTQDTGVLLAASTAYHLRISIDDARVPRYFINGTQVATGAALKDATDYIPYVGITNGSAAAKNMTVRGIAISRNFG